MSLKTDLKFALLLILILGGIFLFALRAVRSAPLSPAVLESKLHRNMTRIEVGKVLGTDLKIKWAFEQTQEANYTVLGRSYRFEFDSNERLQELYVEERQSSGRYESTPLDLH